MDVTHSKQPQEFVLKKYLKPSIRVIGKRLGSAMSMVWKG